MNLLSLQMIRHDDDVVRNCVQDFISFINQGAFSHPEKYISLPFVINRIVVSTDDLRGKLKQFKASQPIVLQNIQPVTCKSFNVMFPDEIRLFTGIEQQADDHVILTAINDSAVNEPLLWGLVVSGHESHKRVRTLFNPLPLIDWLLVTKSK